MYHVHVNASIRFKAIQHNSFIDTVYIYHYIRFFFYRKYKYREIVQIVCQFQQQPPHNVLVLTNISFQILAKKTQRRRDDGKCLEIFYFQ